METLLGIAVLAAFALIGGGIWALVRRRGKPLNAALMIGVGLIVLVNVWLNTLPLPPSVRG